MVKDPKKLVLEMVTRVGKLEARRLLVNEGISISTVDKLLGSRYPNELGGMMTSAIMRAAALARQQAS